MFQSGEAGLVMRRVGINVTNIRLLSTVWYSTRQFLSEISVFCSFVDCSWCVVIRVLSIRSASRALFLKCIRGFVGTAVHRDGWDWFGREALGWIAERGWCRRCFPLVGRGEFVKQTIDGSDAKPKTERQKRNSVSSGAKGDISQTTDGSTWVHDASAFQVV